MGHCSLSQIMLKEMEKIRYDVDQKVLKEKVDIYLIWLVNLNCIGRYIELFRHD